MCSPVISREQLNSYRYIYLFIHLTSLTANVFVGAIGAVLFAVAKQSAFHAVAVTAGQRAIRAERFLGIEKRFGLSLLILGFAVVDRVLPVAGLLIDVEVQTSWTTNRLQTGTGALDHVATVVTLASYQPKPLARVFVFANFILKTFFFFFFLSLNAI